MAEEEFEESEVIFEDKVRENIDSYESNSRNGNNIDELRGKRLTWTNKTKSTPVNVPESSFWPWYAESNLDSGGDDVEMMPPHVIVGRRLAGKMMSFSVCTGVGRTLKGRDLSRVRNSVLRMTGFLET
ncbi:hypothetical protein STAS_00081 [Striga asiatica]|uniref:Senescence regulator S40 n=1 Tax=Striga asiatica TaxID=4170 RepID=A0A5A7NW65_STRAF|nr:hypothetical protein STAS_00081 [Striga asiatica]